MASIYADTLLIPLYTVALSLAVYLVHLVYVFISPPSPNVTTPEPENLSPNHGFFSDVKAHINAHGGAKHFTYKLVRLLSCITLLCLSIASLVLDELELEDKSPAFVVQPSTDGFFAVLLKWGKKKRRQRKKLRDQLTRSEWLLFAMCITYMYASLLSLVSLLAKPLSTVRSRAVLLSRAASKHLTLILLVTFGVYAYRDLYPLTTFPLLPVDLPPKHATMPLVAPLLWTHIAVLGLTAILLPLCQPRMYIPIDRMNPSKEPNPEQTASILSLALYTFLDPTIFLAYRIPHLSHDQLPPLADYDHAPFLRKRGFPHMDPFGYQPVVENSSTVDPMPPSKVAKRHLFFGLMRTFWREYMFLSFMLMTNVVAGFASPIGVNRLLNYMETRGDGALIRPWVWIVWLFVGPLIGSIAMQWYIFIATGTLVRTESIITQLVFEHALRIRVRASGSSTSDDASAGITTEATTHSQDLTLLQVPESAPSALPGLEIPPPAERERSESESTRSTLVGTLKSRIRSTFSRKGGRSVSKDDKRKTKAKGKGTEEKTSSAENLHGKINNLVTTDLGNIVEARDFLFTVVYIPLQIALGIWFLYAVLGWSAFAGLSIMLVLFPVPGKVAQIMQKVQQERMKRTDGRVQSVTETMNVLRMIKLFGWERKMEERIAEKRETELVYVWKRNILELINGMINHIIPVGTMTVIMKQELSASKVFSSMTVFDMLREQLHMVIYTFSVAIQGKVSIDRIDEFMKKSELLDKYANLQKPEESTVGENDDGGSTIGKGQRPATSDSIDSPTLDMASGIAPPGYNDVIGFCDASFTWSAEDTMSSSGIATPFSASSRATSTLSLAESSASATVSVGTSGKRKFVLRVEGELIFQRGRINLVVGPTGSGKTSLLMALLGEMHFIPAEVGAWFNLPRAGGLSYAAQESWVQNETIRENIVFGAPFDEERYHKVIYQCCLERDLELFEAGDKTEVGEKGLTLSGGQKARITLARAIYSRAEIILLDDVLAALDVHTAKWIVEKCFTGDLIKGRTVILVTHNVAMASPIADYVVSLGLDGRVVSRGSVTEAITKNKALAKEVKADETALKKAGELVDDAQVPAEPGAEPKKASDGKLIVEEEIEEGHVGWPALKMYLSGLGGAHPFLFFLAYIGGSLITQFILSFQTWFLGLWASQYENHPASEVSVRYYLSYYALLLAACLLGYGFTDINFYLGVLRASRRIHQQLVQAVLGTTLRWLDTTPTSRVIARCTQDIRAVDGPIAQGLMWLMDLTTAMLIRFAAVVFFTPVFVFPGVLIAVLGGWCGQIYIAAQLSVKREMSNAKSPVLGHFGAAIAGLTSIRAYGAENAFKKESMARIDRYTRAARTFYNLNRWICIRIDALGGMFASGLAAYLIYFSDHNASNTGFSLNMAVAFSSMILWWVRILNDFEVQGNSLERIQGYTQIEQEPKPTAEGEPPAYWPSSGELVVENLSARYSPNGPAVLHGVSFHIKSGERVGVVGRTGSGKSSLTLSLLRCIYTEGNVIYDGISTASVNLDALRSSITIIPQVPELLSGTLRQNLDPFSQFDDATLNDALRAAGLFSLQSSDDEGRITLDTAISSGGGNLSVGQRQILALARAIVRGSKLLILDEATSAIDYKTDSVIQSSLRNELGNDVTLVTVAHRLQTIMDADKIMVLDAGRIVEFDSPKELLKNKDGKLRALVDESGDRDILIAMAEGQGRL